MLRVFITTFLLFCFTYLNAESRPNIVWIMFDDGRADALGSYGAKWAKTPHLDEIAKSGVRFETAVVQNPVCVPLRTSLKTGLYPHQTGVIAMGRVPAETPAPYASSIIRNPVVLLDAFKDAGMLPHNVGKAHAFRKHFKLLGDVPPLLNHGGRPHAKRAKALKIDASFKKVKTDTHKWLIGGVVDVDAKHLRQSMIGEKAVKAIKDLSSKKEPFFLRVSFHAPHVACFIDKEHYIDPKTIDLPLPKKEHFALKPAYEQKNIKKYSGATLTKEEIDIARGTYYGMVHLADKAVGRVVAELKKQGIYDNTIIAVNSDSGFQLGEHGNWKKRDFYDTNVKVPLIFSYPKRLPKGKVIEEPIEMIDFLPTLMDLTSIDVPKNQHGRSLLPLIDGKVTKWNDAVFSEHDHAIDMYKELRQGGGRRVMVRTKEWKLIFFMDSRIMNKDYALYNLKEDPWEKINLAKEDKYKDKIKDLENMAIAWDKRTGKLY